MRKIKLLFWVSFTVFNLSLAVYLSVYNNTVKPESISTADSLFSLNFAKCYDIGYKKGCNNAMKTYAIHGINPNAEKIIYNRMKYDSVNFKKFIGK